MKSYANLTSVRPDRFLFAAAAGVSLLALSTPAIAQPAPSDQDQVSSEAATDEEIIVTARRRAEALDEVPSTVNVVTGADLERLAINNLDELDKLVAGLQIVGANVSMRGITFNLTAGSGNTVATYINEAPVLSSTIFTSTFDIGQVEVLRGPQGTTRGLAAPSGAITQTTRRPDLSEIGGYANFQVNNHHGWNGQAALNIPIIPDVLAVRIAGLINRTDANGVLSVHNPKRPFTEDVGGRVSLRFEPTDTISINAIYHHVSEEGASYGSAVFGTGSPGCLTLPNTCGMVNPNVPPGYNGPVLGIDDNRAVQGFASPTDNDIRMWIVNGDWRFAGQKLSTVLSWQDFKLLTKGAGDAGNTLLGFPLFNSNIQSHDVIRTQEVRLASDERIFDIFDYVVGVFHRTDVVETEGPFSNRFLTGAFGAPGSVPNPNIAPNLNYVLVQQISNPSDLKETSFFGNLMAHIGDSLEVSGGLRHINFDLIKGTVISLPQALTSISSAPLGGNCALAGGVTSAAYGAGFCDITIAARTIPFVLPETHVKTWVWDASISYHVTPDLMVYGHAGSSWRQPFAGVGIGSTSSLASQLVGNIAGSPEESKGWEVGVKWGFLGGRGHIFVDYFQQKFDSLIVSTPAFYITADPGSPGAPFGTGSSFGFFSNVPAKIKGFDVEVGFNEDRWNFVVNYSRSKGRITGNIPCTDTNFDGVADLAPAANTQAQRDYIAALLQRGTIYAMCPGSIISTSTAPPWNLRARSEINLPISNVGEAFLRGVFQYQPKNKNASATFATPAYSLLDLFLGLRAPDGAWEVSVWGKNILNTNKILSNINTDPAAGPVVPEIGGPQGSPFGTTGYRTVTFTPRREFGLTGRIAFGSR